MSSKPLGYMLELVHELCILYEKANVQQEVLKQGQQRRVELFERNAVGKSGPKCAAWHADGRGTRAVEKGG